MLKKLSVIVLSTVIAFAGMTSAEAKKVNTKGCSVTHVTKKPLGKKAIDKKKAQPVKSCKAKKAK